MQNGFSKDELNIIKTALNKQYDHLRDVCDTIDGNDTNTKVEPLTSITWNSGGIKETVRGTSKSEEVINSIQKQQEEIENIVEKINDLIVFGTANLHTDHKQVLLESFDRID